jgi:hypothetical protein
MTALSIILNTNHFTFEIYNMSIGGGMPTHSYVASASTHYTDTITATWILSLDNKIKLCRLNDSIKNSFEQ